MDIGEREDVVHLRESFGFHLDIAWLDDSGALIYLIGTGVFSNPDTIMTEIV